MEYFRLKPADAQPEVEAPVPGNRAGDLVFALLHDMAVAHALALGELPVRRRMEELAVRVEDCDTLGGNLAVIAAQGPQTAEDREILCFYFALGLKGRLERSQGPKRQRVLLLLRETLDFLAGIFGPRILGNVSILGEAERQMLWDLVGGTVLALGREQHVGGVDPAGALMRWTGLFGLAPRTDRLVVVRALLAAGPPPAGRLVLVGILDPLADAELLAQVLLPRPAPAGLAELEGPEPDLTALADPAESLELAAEGSDSGEGDLGGTGFTPLPEPTYEVSGRAVPLRSPGRRLVARLTGWALAERAAAALAAVFLGVRREGHLRLSRAGLVYDEALFVLGHTVRQRTVAIPMESMAARLDRNHNLGTLLVGLGAAVVCAFLGVLWTLDGFRTGYWPLFLLGGATIFGGLVVDLLLFRLSGRLRGRSQLVLDGGEGTRIRLNGVRRAEAEALLAALAGPSRFSGLEPTCPGTS